MKAAIYSGLEQIGWQEVERLKPAAGYVTLKTRCTGICGSDLHNYFGHWPPTPGLAAGHETCGIIEEVGADVSGWQPGDKVAPECFSHCGDCVYCRTGAYNLCLNRLWTSYQTHGGFAEYASVHASSVFKLPEQMTFEEGALVEPLAVGVRAVAQAGVANRLAIIGGGTIGLVCLAAAKAVGVQETLITVKYEQQAQVAQELGANHIVHIGRSEVKKYVTELTGGLGMDGVIETVGGAQHFNDGLDITRKQGRLVLVAGYHQPLAVDLRRVVWSEVMVIGSNCYAYSGLKTDFQAAIDLIASNPKGLTRLVTHRFPIAEISAAFKVAADKTSGAIKVHLYQE